MRPERSKSLGAGIEHPPPGHLQHHIHPLSLAETKAPVRSSTAVSTAASAPSDRHSSRFSEWTR